MDPYHHPPDSIYQDFDDSTPNNGPYYTRNPPSSAGGPPSPPRASSAMHLGFLLNPSADNQQYAPDPLHSHSSARPVLPSLHTSYTTGPYERSLSYSSNSSTSLHDFSRTSSHRGSESPAALTSLSYPAPYSAPHTRQEVEAAHTLAHVGTGGYAPAAPSSPDANAPGRQYPCPLAMMYQCSKKFSTSGHARRHSRTHTGERSAVCPECGHRFSRQDNMQQHRRTHREKPGRRGSSRRLEEEAEE